MEKEIKRICLYHFSEIPKISLNCENCKEDYDKNNCPCNYDCPNFFPFPQVAYEEVIEELEKRNMKITPKIENLLKREIGIVDIVIASKRIKVSPKKIIDDLTYHIKDLSR